VLPTKYQPAGAAGAPPEVGRVGNRDAAVWVEGAEPAPGLLPSGCQIENARSGRGPCERSGLLAAVLDRNVHDPIAPPAGRLHRLIHDPGPPADVALQQVSVEDASALLRLEGATRLSEDVVPMACRRFCLVSVPRDPSPFYNNWGGWD
jgi:hypothetical protein